VRRRNTQDEEIRRLERQAAQGDVNAIRRLRAIRRRTAPVRPSKFRKFATWDEIAWALWPKGERGVHFVAFDEISPAWIDDAAWEYSKDKIREFEEEHEVKLSDEQRSAITSRYAWAIERIWTAEALLKDEINKALSPINEWAERELDEDLDWYYHPPKVGTAIDWGAAEDPDKGSGIWFKVYRPILRVLQDVRRDDRSLSTIDIEDVIALAREIWESEHGTSRRGRRGFMEPSDHHGDSWDTPTDDEIMEAVMEEGPLIPRSEEDEEEEDLS
jgi:hypothetical protein